MPTLGFTDNDSIDVGNKYVTKEYLIDRYPNIATHSNMPTLWTWGIGSSGQLGDNLTATARSTSSPGTVFAGASNWKTVDANYHIAGIRQNGSLWTWGSNINGELGIGSTVSRSSPGTTAGTNLTIWTKVSTGVRYTAAIQSNGSLWTWGLNTGGQLGSGSTTSRQSPVTTIGAPALGANDTWQQIAAGDTHMLAIKTDGNLYSWGTSASGALGASGTLSRSSPVSVAVSLSAVANNIWNFVAAGTNFSVGITSDGRLWTWGLNTNFQLGDTTSTNKSSPITTAGGGTNWKLASCGYSHTVAVKTDGSVWTWGKNDFGQLAFGASNASRSSPDTVTGAGLNWIRIHAGGNSSGGIKSDGSLWTWGANLSGECGDGNTSNSKTSPAQTAIPVTSWKVVAAGNGTLCAIKEEDDW
jgi:alpha-tubulin suppressor-like RCC1 family protein